LAGVFSGAIGGARCVISIASWVVNFDSTKSATHTSHYAAPLFLRHSSARRRAAIGVQAAARSRMSSWIQQPSVSRGSRRGDYNRQDIMPTSLQWRSDSKGARHGIRDHRHEPCGRPIRRLRRTRVAHCFGQTRLDVRRCPHRAARLLGLGRIGKHKGEPLWIRISTAYLTRQLIAGCGNSERYS
jgi:hypothetical protein